VGLQFNWIPLRLDLCDDSRMDLLRGHPFRILFPSAGAAFFSPLTFSAVAVVGEGALVDWPIGLSMEMTLKFLRAATIVRAC